MTRRPCTCASPDGVTAAPACPACLDWRAAHHEERPRGVCGICGVAFLLSAYQQATRTDNKRVYCGERCLARARSGSAGRRVRERRRGG